MYHFVCQRSKCTMLCLLLHVMENTFTHRNTHFMTRWCLHLEMNGPLVSVVLHKITDILHIKISRSQLLNISDSHHNSFVNNWQQIHWEIDRSYLNFCCVCLGCWCVFTECPWRQTTSVDARGSRWLDDLRGSALTLQLSRGDHTYSFLILRNVKLLTRPPYVHFPDWPQNSSSYIRNEQPKNKPWTLMQFDKPLLVFYNSVCPTPTITESVLSMHFTGE